MSLATYQQCNAPALSPYIPDPRTNFYSEGDICAIRESVATPVFILLTGRPPASQGSVPNRTWGSLRSSGWTINRESTDGIGLNEYSKQPRPCVVLGLTKISPPPATATICLMATFYGAKSPTKLPQVLQHSCVPLSPHYLASHGQAHAHTSSEWSNDVTWIIAFRFRSSCPIQGRWEDRKSRDKPGASYKLSQHESDKLLNVCNQRRLQWDTLCLKDPKLPHFALQKFKDFCADNIERKKRWESEHRRSGSQPSSPIEMRQPRGQSAQAEFSSAVQATSEQPVPAPTDTLWEHIKNQLAQATHKGKRGKGSKKKNPKAGGTLSDLRAENVGGTSASKSSPSLASHESKPRSLSDSPLVRAARKLFSSSSKIDVTDSAQ
ncbi:hypothetical protein BD413DRAFT_307411 [Trametes elegans]|nr:hypothetical protein BD413DRAFT_307411 [Trametes elegans]